MKPMLLSHLRSLTVPGTSAKQSHIKLALHAFVFDLQPNLDRIDSLVNFFKSPPGVKQSTICFQSVSFSLRHLKLSYLARRLGFK